MAVSDLVFVSTIAELQHIDKLHPSLLAPNSMAVTPEFGVAMMLALQGKPWCSLFDFLTPQEQIANVAEAWQLVRNWWRPWLESVDFEGVVLANVMETDLFYPLLASINAAQAVGRVLQEQRPQRVFVFDDQGGPWIYAGGGPYNRVVNAMTRWWGERAGIDVHLLSPPPPPGPRDARENHGRSQNRRTVGYQNAVAHRSSRPIILGIVDRYDLLRQGKLPAVLAQRDEFDYVQVRLDARQTLGDGDSSADYRVVDLASLMRWPATFHRVDKQLDQAWSAFQIARRSFAGSRAALFTNPYLDFQYRGFWNNLRHGARLIYGFNQVIKALQPALCLYQDDYWGWRRCLIETARQHGIPTLSLIHGGVLSPLDVPMSTKGSDLILAWGEMDKEVLLAAGQPPERIALVGSLIYDEDYQACCQAASRSKELHACQSLRQQIGLPERKPVVFVLSSPINVHGHSLASIDLHIESWRAVARVAQQLPDVEFVVKPHPNRAYGDWEALQCFCAEAPPNLHFLEQALSLRDILPVGDAALCVDAPTTAAIEAMLHHLPVIYLRAARWKPEDGYTLSLDEAGPLIIDDLAGLEAAIRQVLYDVQARQSLANRCLAFSMRFIDAGDRLTLERVVTLIEERATLSKERPDCRGSFKLPNITVLGESIKGGASMHNLDAIEEAARMAWAVTPIPESERPDWLVWFSREVDAWWHAGVKDDAYVRSMQDVIRRIASALQMPTPWRQKAEADALVGAGHWNFQNGQFAQSARYMAQALGLQPSLLLQDRGVMSVLMRSLWRFMTPSHVRDQE